MRIGQITAFAAWKEKTQRQGQRNGSERRRHRFLSAALRVFSLRIPGRALHPGKWRVPGSIKSSRYQRRPEIAAVVQGGRTVMTAGGRYFALNDVGTRIWQLLEQPRSVDDVARIIEAEYEAPGETIRRDTEQIVAELARRRLVISK